MTGNPLQKQGRLHRAWRIAVPPALRLHLYWIRRAFQTLGWMGGWRFLAHSLTGPSRSIAVALRATPHPLFVRTKTSDIAVLHQVFAEKSYDIEELKSPRLIIDGGANVGYSAVWFATKFPQAKVIAIEPEESNYQLLRKNTSQLGNVEAIKAAIWSHRCQLKIGNPEEEKWQFRVVPSECVSQPSTSLDAVTIGDLLTDAEARDIDLLKLDVEGAEEEIFAGDTTWLARTRLLVIELHDFMLPGCGDSFRAAISQHRFEERTSGEHQILVNTGWSGPGS